MTFNPHDRVIPVQEGILQRGITLRGEWGVLKAESGIVRANDWSGFYLLPPTQSDGPILGGENYIIELNDGYELRENNGIWTITESCL